MATKAQLQTVAEAAKEVWLDTTIPSRWFEQEGWKSKAEHMRALKAALIAAGYQVENSIDRTTRLRKSTTDTPQSKTITG